MSVSNRGFFLLELLLSLSALLMICLFFIPLLIDLRSQSAKLEVETMARQLVYEELQASLHHNRTDANYTVIQNGIGYHLYWTDSGITGLKEVCVEVEYSTFLPYTKVCGIQE